MCHGVECSILILDTIFDNKYHGIFHGISAESIWTCSMESKVDMPKFHMESSGIHVE